ncbi:hypothetical protein IPG36_03320 [bacterium]|nr:MAG: hypothetical protein IPG36_03320 [bacterium]
MWGIVRSRDGGILNYDHLEPVNNWLKAFPNRPEIYTYFGIFAVMVIAGAIYRLVLARRYRKSVAWQTLGRRVLAWSQTTGWVDSA